ncbi:MAG TPA: BMP family ABC transporter substrate-binding protein [Acidimicrobiales bacterium]|nr:BMP family ABC transporter substrate-binding protein [Acidimicrobiales bacterium]
MEDYVRKKLSSWRLLLALLAVFALVAAACGDDDDDTATDDDTTETTAAPDEGDDDDEGTTETTEGGEEPAGDIRVGMVYDIGGRGDQSFNDAAALGLDQAAEELGVETEDLEPTAGGENREELLRLLAEEGFDLVIGVGFAFEEAVLSASADFPDTTFAIVDAAPEGDNIEGLVFAEEQGSFLVGAAAALTSQTGNIGFVGGVEIPLIQKFQAGYEAGARAVNPDIEIQVSYITQPPDFAGFTDPARGKEVAASMFQGGADVVYHAAGGSGNGVFEAASEAGAPGEVWAIGVDSDQYLTVGEPLNQYILTSMLKRVDVAVFETIKAFTEGDTEGGVRVFDLSVDGVGFATSGDFLPADVVTQLEDLKAQIVAGEIEVPTAP